ncbi:nucleotide sugar dehydrogenase [Nocardioides sp. HDW12B]|nr:nucleotide sugar dehydrogenase [Nocardioides sp. HDW12B]
MRAVEVGYSVVGLDTDNARVAGLLDGQSYVEDVEGQTVAAALQSGRYLPTTNPEDAADFDYAIITVPTPLKETLPDLTFIEDATRALAQHLKPGATVVLESTTYPGTTEELMVPILESVSGLTVASDFHAGYSPERIDPGNQTYTFVNTPKVVSGIGVEGRAAVVDLYRKLVDEVVPVATPKEAELTKLLENTFRHVNIALVNELAVFARDLGIDVWESIDAASTKPFGYMRFTPGPGVGGHCLPVDPSYLSWQVRKTLGHSFRFVELANDVNEHMPDYVVRRLILALNKQRRSVAGSRIVLLGMAYKKNTGDSRESPSRRIADLLHELEAEVVVIDDYVPTTQVPGFALHTHLSDEELHRADAVVLLTDHDNVDYELVSRSGVYVLDTRRRMRGENVELL